MLTRTHAVYTVVYSLVQCMTLVSTSEMDAHNAFNVPINVPTTPVMS